jgi:glycosyltransferase involved in cell wall biosynthesis
MVPSSEAALRGHDPIRLLALVPKAPGLSPGQRFRIEQWAPLLAQHHGIKIDFDPFESPRLSEVLYKRGRIAGKAGLILRDGVRRCAALWRARSFDGVIVYREATLLGGSYLEWMLRRLARLPLIYDFDDAIWEVAASYRNGRSGLSSLVRAPWKTGAICRMASAVTVGNAFLAEYAGRYNRDVTIVRTALDLARFTPGPSRQGPFTIVWTGSHSTLPYLESLRDVFRRVGDAVPTRVRVICDERPADFENVVNEFVPWSADTEVRALQDVDVGVMPLPDTLSARGKCGFKALQYMAVGHPAVVSPVGMNREIVTDGENGFWATSDDEWVEALLTLARDRDLRNRMGTAGRRVVEAEFSVGTAAAAFATVVRRAVRA